MLMFQKYLTEVINNFMNLFALKVLVELPSPTNKVTSLQLVLDLCSFNTETSTKEWVVWYCFFRDLCELDMTTRLIIMKLMTITMRVNTVIWLKKYDYGSSDDDSNDDGHEDYGGDDGDEYNDDNVIKKYVYSISVMIMTMVKMMLMNMIVTIIILIILTRAMMTTMMITLIMI